MKAEGAGPRTDSRNGRWPRRPAAGVWR